MKLACSKPSLFWIASILFVAPVGCTTTTPSSEESTGPAAGESAEVEGASADAGTAEAASGDSATEEAAASDDVTLDSASNKDGAAPASDGASAPAQPVADAAPPASADASTPVAPASEAPPSTVDATPTTAAGAPEAAATTSAAEQTSPAGDSEKPNEGAALAEQPAAAEDKEAHQAPAEKTPAVSAAPAAVATSTTASQTDDSLQQQRLYGNRLFGQSRIQLGVNQPIFNENQKGYETLYGKAKAYPTVMVDWFPLDWWVNPGLSINLGGYSVAGMASKKTPDDSIVPDEKSHTNLLFIPIQGSIKVEVTPFRQKWVVFDGWVGYEYGWWQETTSTATTTSSIHAWHMATGDTSTDTTKPTSKGVKYASVMGASANILLNSLDERTVRSMISTMGMSHVYLSPFLEIVKTTNPSGLTFGRNVYGVGFTFETLR